MGKLKDLFILCVVVILRFEKTSTKKVEMKQE